MPGWIKDATFLVMHFRGLVCWVAAASTFAMISASLAGTLAIRRTPILSATLPTNTTYQIESSPDGNAWAATGVLVAGQGEPLTVPLDGFPGNLAYRFSGVGTVDTILPTVTTGLHLAGSFPGASEVRIETNATLDAQSWALRDFVFADATGSYRRGLRAPLPGPMFFRAVRPATPLDLASVASYTADPNAGYSGFGVVADDMPQLYRDGFIGAPCPVLYHRGGMNAASAGECYELAGPSGSVTVMVGDVSSVPPPDTCDAGRTFFDLGDPAFASLFDTASGLGTATYRLVPAPVAGNVKLVVVVYAAGFYFELRPYNYRAGISTLEIRSPGSDWTELPRTAYNSFVYNNGAAIGFPLSVRVTSRFGETVEFPEIASMTVGNRLSANAQFVAFPDQSPAPVWILPPVYEDTLSNIPGGQWNPFPYGGVTLNPSYTGSVYQGAASLQLSGFSAFSGVVFIHTQRFPKPPEGIFEFAIRSASGSINSLAITFSGFEGGGSVTSSTVRLPTVDTTWRLMRIPLEPAHAPAQIKDFRITNNSSSVLPSVLLDSMAFRPR